jgi:dihydroneopterin aldolase
LLTIHLNNLLFHAYHGLYEEEQILGNNFEVNITIHQLKVPQKINSIDDTIDYSKVYEMVKMQMTVPTPLLETVAQKICTTIIAQFNLVDWVKCSITKINPPIIQFQGTVGISFEMKREN